MVVSLLTGKIVSGKVFWATVCKAVHPILSVRCLFVCLSVCLSVTLVYCGQTVGRDQDET